MALDRLLQQLAEPHRVLMIGAHPDDEDTSLLALLARGYGADAAYLSLSRGEGGQNLIGPELGPALGLLRTGELVSAREVDGARQFFTRAFDFGYTRSLEETAAKWPLDTLLKDAVRIIRRLRPHVIVSVFSGTPRDGHGQHQAAGVTARAAFDAAGDPGRFPELGTEEGLEPWTPLKLYRSTRFDTTSTTTRIPTGGLDPLTGRSFFQMAMASRSRHRSQDMGQLQPLGPRLTRLQLLVDRTDGPHGGDELFSGIAVPRSRVAVLADSVRRTINLAEPARVVPLLIAALAADPTPVERRQLERALAIAAGVEVDGVTDRERLVAGDTVPVTVQVYNGGTFPVTLDNLDLRVPAGWGVIDTTGADTLPAGGLVVRTLSLVVPADAEPTTPYFLVRPRQGDLYDWSRADPAVRGTPMDPPPVQVMASLRVLDHPLAVSREVAYRYRDQALGEVRRPLHVVPLVEVRVSPERLVWPTNRFAEQTLAVTLRYHGDRRYTGEVVVTPGDWSPPAPQGFTFTHNDETRQMRFVVPRPGGVRDARVRVQVVARGDDGREFSSGVRSVDYPHIRPAFWVVRARTRIVMADLALPVVARIGYIRGAADRVPEALRQIGVPVEVLAGADLDTAGLAGYDVIVVGSRAYEADPDLGRFNDRLLAYARAGGHVVVQYQQYAFVRGGYAPYPLTIARPHDRITDETAPVRVLEPGDPVVRTPNRLGPADWEGWPQERGLYFAHTWDEAYRPVLSMHDPGGPDLEGGLLVADYGAGTYIYTGVSFFRALPAGVPGAFKLFLNLVGYRHEDLP